MTKYYKYSFNVHRKKPGTAGRNESDWYLEPVTLVTKVTDRMEERVTHKPGCAAMQFNQILRSSYGYNRPVVTATRISEITKEEYKASATK